MSRDCEHGQLARSCSICDLERELKAVTQQRDKLLAALESLLLITADSEGVAGYHLNGAVANWDEFPEVNEAALLVAQMKGQS
jgi:hypothetical protein